MILDLFVLILAYLVGCLCCEAIAFLLAPSISWLYGEAVYLEVRIFAYVIIQGLILTVLTVAAVRRVRRKASESDESISQGLKLPSPLRITLRDPEKPDVLLEKYKTVVASIVPAYMVSSEGLLADAAFAKLTIRSGISLGIWISYGIIKMPQGLYVPVWPGDMLLDALSRHASDVKPRNYDRLRKFFINKTRRSGSPHIWVCSDRLDTTLAHEAMHSIQDFLSALYPDQGRLLRETALSHKVLVSKLAERFRNQVGYCANDMFDNKPGAYAGMYSRLESNPPLSVLHLRSVIRRVAATAEAMHDNDEIIPTLLALHVLRVGEATEVLAEIFRQSGLRDDFCRTSFEVMPV